MQRKLTFQGDKMDHNGVMAKDIMDEEGVRVQLLLVTSGLCFVVFAEQNENTVKLLIKLMRI